MHFLHNELHIAGDISSNSLTRGRVGWGVFLKFCLGKLVITSCQGSQKLHFLTKATNLEIKYRIIPRYEGVTSLKVVVVL
jgi:hypothetical protein